MQSKFPCMPDGSDDGHNEKNQATLAHNLSISFARACIFSPIFVFSFNYFVIFLFIQIWPITRIYIHTQYPLLRTSSYLTGSCGTTSHQQYILNSVDYFANDTVNENKPCNHNQLHKHGSNSARTQENKYHQPNK